MLEDISNLPKTNLGKKNTPQLIFIADETAVRLYA